MKRTTRLVAIGFVATAVGAGTWIWLDRTPPLPKPIIPVVGSLANRPALLSQRLAAAEAKARVSRSAREGMAELGRLYHANGFTAEAEACWRWLRVAEPAEPRWAYLLADLRNTAGDPEAFEALLRETLQLAPDHAPARQKLAEIAFKSGRTDEAVVHYEARLALLPGDPYSRLGLARAAMQRGQTNEARRRIAELVRDHPDFPPAHNLHAEFLAAAGDEAGARRHRWLGRESGRFREADDPWLQGLTAWCYDPQRLAVLGTAEFQLARGDRGRALIERSVQLAPEDPAGHELLGDLYLKLKEPALARSSLSEALRLNQAAGVRAPANLYVNLADAWRQTGRPDEALRVIDEGLTRLGGPFELHLARGVILDGMERVPEAEVALRKALALNPNDAEANHFLGLVLLQLDRQPEAVGYLKQALVQQPTYPKVLALLGQLELEAGRLAAAGEFLEPLFEANPGLREVQELTAYWRLQSGLAAAAQNAPAAAERHYRGGLEAQPENVDLLISLGAMLLAQGRAAEAEASLVSYRRLRPNEAQGAALLGEAWLTLGRGDEARRVLIEGEQLALRAGQTRIAQRCRELLTR